MDNKNWIVIVKFEDNKGGSVTLACKDLKHYKELTMRYNNRGWKQMEYIEEAFVESYPF